MWNAKGNNTSSFGNGINIIAKLYLERNGADDDRKAHAIAEAEPKILFTIVSCFAPHSVTTATHTSLLLHSVANIKQIT